MFKLKKRKLIRSSQIIIKAKKYYNYANDDSHWICKKCKILYEPKDDVVKQINDISDPKSETKILCPKCKNNLYSGSKKYFESSFKLIKD